jgi:hypothetical protein
MAWQAAILVGELWLGEVTRPRPHKTTFDEFKKSNQPIETRPIVYAGGTVELTPARIWYGDFSQRAVERDSHWTDYLWAGSLAFLLDTITVAYRYYCAEVFALQFGPDTNVERVRIDDRLMYQATVGSDNAGGGFLIDDPQAWGGDQPPGQGGEYSWCDITRGNYTDHTNAYLETVLTTPPNKTPSLRGVSCLVKRARSGFTESGYFAAGGVGYQPRFREWKVTTRRQPDNLATGFNKIGRHMNPMETVYEWATNIEYGARCPVGELNIASMQTCAQTLYDEGLGWSGKIESTTHPIDVIQNIMQMVDCQATPSPSLGLTFKLVRRDYSFGSLRTLDQSTATSVDRMSPGTYEDTVNKIIVPFLDQDNNFQPRPGIYVDAANQSIQGGRTVPQTQDYLGVGDYSTANLLATRDGRALSIPRASLTCNVLPSFGKLTTRGEVLFFEWSSPSFTKIMRVLAITPGNTSNPDYQLVMVEDQFAIGYRTAGEPVGSQHSDPAVGLDTAPPDAAWDTDIAPCGLVQNVITTNSNQFESVIEGHIVFDTYAAGGQYARIWVTEPGGVQTLSPVYLSPDTDNKAMFTWPAIAVGTYEFCVQTYSLHGVTDDVKVCCDIAITQIGSPSVSPSHSASPSRSPSASGSPSVSTSSSVSPSHSLSPSSSASPSSAAGLPDLALWLMADAGVYNDAGSTLASNADGVYQWNDQSGNNNHALQATGGNRPQFLTGALNGLPTVRFNGFTPNWLTLTNTILGGVDSTVFVVGKYSYDTDGAFTDVNFVLGSEFTFIGGGLYRMQMAGNAELGALRPRMFGPIGEMSGTDLTINTYFQANLRRQDSFPRPSWWRVNMVADGTNPTNGSFGTDGGSKVIGKAAGDSNNSPFYGDLCELIVYHRQLTDAEIATVEYYLNDKWFGQSFSPSPSPSASVSPSHSTSPSVSPSSSVSASTSPSGSQSPSHSASPSSSTSPSVSPSSSISPSVSPSHSQSPSSSASPSGPTLLASDDFHRANSGTLGTANVGGNWTIGGAVSHGTFAISSNVALFTHGAGPTTVWLNPSVADCTIEGTVGTTKPNNGIWFRGDAGGQNGFLFVSGSAKYQVFKMTTASSFTQVGTDISVTPTNGDVLKVVLSGDNMDFYINGVLKLSASNSFQNTETHHGFYGGTSAGDDGGTWTLFTITG